MVIDRARCRLVALGATMLVGAGAIIQQKEVALAEAGRKAFGVPGLVLVTIAAAFSTASAINATLFATARLMGDIAEHIAAIILLILIGRPLILRRL